MRSLKEEGGLKGRMLNKGEGKGSGKEIRRKRKEGDDVVIYSFFPTLSPVSLYFISATVKGDKKVSRRKGRL